MTKFRRMLITASLPMSDSLNVSISYAWCYSCISRSMNSDNMTAAGQASDEQHVGRDDISAYWDLVADPDRAKDGEAVLQRQEGSSGLMLFTTYDHGTFSRRTHGAQP